MDRFKLSLLGLAFLAALVAPASALTTYVGPAPSGEQDLSLIMTTLYGTGNYARVDDGWDQIWHNPNGHARAQVKYAGYTQRFGFFAGLNPLSAFTGMFDVTGTGYAPTVTAVSPFAPDAYGWYSFDQSQTGTYFRFGDDPNGVNVYPPAWSSRMSDNNTGDDHMVTFLLNTGNYVVCWEDRESTPPVGQNCWDRDYNDLVVEVHGVNPIPEPTTLALLGMALAGAGVGLLRRRSR